MNDSMTVTPLRAEDLAVLVTCWQIGVPLVETPDQTWLNYVLETDHVHVYCLRRLDEQQQLLAYAQFDIEGQDAWVAVVTDPREIRKGFASRLIQESAQSSRRLGVNRIVAAVQSKNLASISFFQRAGFAEHPESEIPQRDAGFVYLFASLEPVGKTT